MNYRVVINEQYKVKLYCDFILSLGDFLSLLVNFSVLQKEKYPKFPNST